MTFARDRDTTSLAERARTRKGKNTQMPDRNHEASETREISHAAEGPNLPPTTRPILIDTPGVEASFDDRPTASFTETEWEILENHMAAYFNGDTDVVAAKASDIFGGQRFVGLWKFAKKYRYGLDKKFPYQGDQLVRNQIDALFDGLKAASRRLFWHRTVLLILFLVSLFATTWATYPPASPLTGADQSAQAAAPDDPGTIQRAQGTTIELAELYPAALGLISAFYLLFWYNALTQATRRNHVLYTTFQSEYQLRTVARMLGRYMGTHDLISTTRLRPPHTPTTEAQRLVKQIERFVALMTWIANRVEYYEKRFEVDHWRLLSHHFVLGLVYYAILLILLVAYIAALWFFTDGAKTVTLAGVSLSVFSLSAGLGAVLTLLPFVLGFSEAFGSGGRKEFESGLGIATWIRFSTFNLHKNLAKVVGDQVRRIHQEEDRQR